ncbi:MAG: S8 family serine peptidase [Polaribacter sp.]|jgi:serine protease AprX|nr:S8 family serine peptidase [Polaribacter sp.]MDG1954284.1 S8 family serine peptidase [Polaribacter sp.]MDG2073022.1 S8 family serine peptidase [Polaribacter sp.]
MKKLFPLFVFFISLQLFSQEDAWVYLKDKPNSATFLATPLNMLSQRSLDRRTRQNIALDIKDVPVEATYYNQIKSTSEITVLAKSKWLNAIHVQGTKAKVNSLKNTFTFIQSIEFADNSLNASGKKLPKSNAITKRNKFAEATTDFNYGNATSQITINKGEYLHQQGYSGSGMHIAVIDGGFPNVDTMDAFQRIRDNNQILGGYDFVKRNSNFYVQEFSGVNLINTHGTKVLSTIAGYIDGQFVGSAPDASFYLFITEDTVNEVPLEESLWVEAAERSDSLGVDVINTSLGYSVFFDETKYNYSYSDMNGVTTFISRGAKEAVLKGMIVVTSAGNEGNDPYKYMNAPADVETVFTIGAVNSSKLIAGFSSYGPTANGKIKPDALAHGWNTYVIDPITNAMRTGSGTSYASPIMSGLVACFWQAFPNLTNTQIMQRIRETGDKFNNPHEQYGYGLPNFETAYGNVLNVTEQEFIKGISVYPNPISSTFTLKTTRNNLSSLSIQIFNVIGKKVYEEKNLKSKTIDVSELNTGIYILKIMNETQQKTIKLIKK